MPLLFNESGNNLEGWTLVVGDGNYHAPGVDSVNIADISSPDTPNYSILKANIQKRRIMAHNITYTKETNPITMNCLHQAEYKFKLPYTIATSNTDFNGQTVEGGLFVWDGSNTELDHGLAFQWVINPWDPNYKALRYWDGSNWLPLGVLEPDTEYHTVKFELDIPAATAYITIDNTQFSLNVYSTTPKTGWSTITEARFQAETISIFPAPTGNVPTQEVYFKDWNWQWSTP